MSTKTIYFSEMFIKYWEPRTFEYSKLSKIALKVNVVFCQVKIENKFQLIECQSTSCNLERAFSQVRGHFDYRKERILCTTIEQLMQKSNSIDFEARFKTRLNDFELAPEQQEFQICYHIHRYCSTISLIICFE